MDIVPLIGKAVIKREAEETKTKGGLFIPDNAKEQKSIGTIVGLCIEHWDELKVGMKVIFPKFAGINVKFKEETFAIVNEDDIMAVVND